MKTKRLSALALLLAAFTVCATPAMANPGNGNGNGNGHGNSGNHGNGNGHGNNGNHAAHDQNDSGNASGRKNYGKPDHVEADISYSRARSLAVNYGLTGYESLPPGIAKNLARGKPLPPGIAKKSVPTSMLNELPYYRGYEWKMVGDDLVLIALSTALVTAVINNVFD
ncbi:anti-virulence regulator CigR family protein [Cronobacter sakazakii]